MNKVHYLKEQAARADRLARAAFDDLTTERLQKPRRITSAKQTSSPHLSKPLSSRTNLKPPRGEPALSTEFGYHTRHVSCFRKGFLLECLRLRCVMEWVRALDLLIA